MKYWVVKGNPSENDWDSMLVPGKKGIWRTARPSKDWAKGDRLFFWESSPSRKLIAIGEFTNTDCGNDEYDRRLFEVKYATRRFETPLTIDELRQINAIADASFLKSGPTLTVFPLTPIQAEAVLQLLLSKNSEVSKVWPDQSYSPGSHTSSNASTLQASDLDESLPSRFECTIQRIIRDTAVARQVKLLHNYTCQICGESVELPNGERYAEAHHIRPLGAPHNGPDISANILVVCPNHHAMCDFGAIELSLSQLHTHKNHKLDPMYIKYHNTLFKRFR